VVTACLNAGGFLIAAVELIAVAVIAMDPSRPLLGRSTLLSSSVHAATALLLVVLLVMLLRLPLSTSRGRSTLNACTNIDKNKN
jgi:hypothetical protein